MNAAAKYSAPRWVAWLVAFIIAGAFVWSQFSVRAEVAQALRSHCEGAALRVSYRSSSGIGDDRWWERSAFVCLRDFKSYEIRASNSAAPQVTEGSSWWPGALLLIVVAWVGRKLWVMTRPSAT